MQKEKASSKDALLSIIDDLDDKADDLKIEQVVTPKEEKIIPVSDLLPTGRPHISYSEMHDWIECQWRHKLKYIDKIDLDSESIHTLFGQVVHDSLEGYVSQPKGSRVAINTEQVQKDWTEKHLVEFKQRVAASIYKDYTDKASEFDSSFEPIFDAVPKWMDEQFPDWEIFGAELKLYESVNDSIKNRFFKGFVDCVIKMPNPKKKGEFIYYVLDWKTTSWGWSFEKKTSFNKQLQLVLYKHFISKTYNIPMKDIRCGFVLLKRKPPKSNPEAICELVMVSVGPKTEEKALDIVTKMLMHLNKRLYSKNRMSCKFCKYNNTEYCT